MTAPWDHALDRQLDAARVCVEHPDLVNKLWDFGAGPQDAIGIGRHILSCETVFVDRDLMPLVQLAVDTWQPEPLSAPMIPDAFVSLDPALDISARDGGRVAISAIAWSTTNVFMRGLRSPGIFTLHCQDVDGRPVPENLGSRPYGQVPTAGQSLAVMQALSRLLEQRVVLKHRERPTAHVRARAAKVKRPEADVLVVSLRRPAHRATDGAREVDWTCRWMVSGHWMNAWCPSIETHRQTWVSAYIKGPADAPLRLHSARVWGLVR
jgi:hypothetical protein